MFFTFRHLETKAKLETPTTDHPLKPQHCEASNRMIREGSGH